MAPPPVLSDPGSWHEGEAKQQNEQQKQRRRSATGPSDEAKKSAMTGLDMLHTLGNAATVVGAVEAAKKTPQRRRATPKTEDLEDEEGPPAELPSAASSTASTLSHKQHQLPMFLSKTYHMIEKCDPDVATWSDTGDNFVVKNVEKFASEVLPMYFKHSNFSSFARQLNFYGFRKLRTDPILTTDADPRTASYVRFYHEKFQKDRPDLLHQIKRATKTDQQSKDEIEQLKSEVAKLQEMIGDLSAEMDQKMGEMNSEYNRRINAISGEYEKLATLVHGLIAQQQLNQLRIPLTASSQSILAQAAAAVASQHLSGPIQQQQQPQNQQQSRQHHQEQQQQNHQEPSSSPSNFASLQQGNEVAPPAPIPSLPTHSQTSDLMRSLSQVAAMNLQRQLSRYEMPPPAPAPASGNKRQNSEGSTYSSSPKARRKEK